MDIPDPKPIIVSAPFGNYLSFSGATSTLGTYTVTRRAGTLLRLWRVLSTVRYSWRTQSWVNKLGLPSPGIGAMGGATNRIVSVHGFNAEEWSLLTRQAFNTYATAIEYNLSCPNIEHRGKMLEEAAPAITAAGAFAIAKLPPVRWMDMGKPLWDMGVRTFHLCNTMPSPGGGISGKPLMQYSLWAIDDFRKTFGPAVRIIGGGGVTSYDDVLTYRAAGADHVAIGSMLFNPVNWLKIKKWPTQDA